MPRKKKKAKAQTLTRAEELQMIEEYLSVIKVTRETEGASLQALVGPIINYDFNPEYEKFYCERKNAAGGYKNVQGGVNRESS